MMADLRQWLMGVALTAFAGGLARQLAPKGREQSLVRLVCGLLLTLAILRPLAKLDWQDSMPAGAPLRERAADQAELYREAQQEALSAVIEEKAGAYIWDKANRLGLDCTVAVTAAPSESGIPLPDTVTIRGSYSAVLARWIEDEVGIPAGKQIWLEENAWTQTKGSEN